MDEQQMEEARRIVEYVLTSKTKYAGELWRLLKFYHDNLGNAPPLPVKKTEDPMINIREELEKTKRAMNERRTEMRELEKAARKLYEERTGEKWLPSLRVVQGGGNTSPITRKVTRHKKP